MILEYEYLIGFDENYNCDLEQISIYVNEGGIILKFIPYNLKTKKKLVLRSNIEKIEIRQGYLFLNISESRENIQIGSNIPNFRKKVISYYKYNKRKSIIKNL